jgi:hypothetical protein
MYRKRGAIQAPDHGRQVVKLPHMAAAPKQILPVDLLHLRFTIGAKRRSD